MVLGEGPGPSPSPKVSPEMQVLRHPCPGRLSGPWVSRNADAHVGGGAAGTEHTQHTGAASGPRAPRPSARAVGRGGLVICRAGPEPHLPVGSPPCGLRLYVVCEPGVQVRPVRRSYGAVGSAPWLSRRPPLPHRGPGPSPHPHLPAAQGPQEPLSWPAPPGAWPEAGDELQRHRGWPAHEPAMHTRPRPGPPPLSRQPPDRSVEGEEHPKEPKSGNRKASV